MDFAAKLTVDYYLLFFIMATNDWSVILLTVLGEKNLNEPEPMRHNGIRRLRIGFKIKLINCGADWTSDERSDIESGEGEQSGHYGHDLYLLGGIFVSFISVINYQSR